MFLEDFVALREALTLKVREQDVRKLGFRGLPDLTPVCLIFVLDILTDSISTFYKTLPLLFQPLLVYVLLEHQCACRFGDTMICSLLRDGPNLPRYNSNGGTFTFTKPTSLLPFPFIRVDIMSLNSNSAVWVGLLYVWWVNMLNSNQYFVSGCRPERLDEWSAA